MISKTTPTLFVSDDTEGAPVQFSRETSAVQEINRLHGEVKRLSDESRYSLDGALSIAWQAGKLLINEKARIRRHAGQGAWLPWLQSCFHGSVRIAQRYMQLARRVNDPASLHGLSLRQSYLRLGIPIAPRWNNEAGTPALLPKLPAHTLLAVRLTRLLRKQNGTVVRPMPATTRTPELFALYKQLRALFE